MTKSNLESLVTLFSFNKKSELEKYCKETIIHKRDFADFIMSCKYTSFPFHHRIHYKDLMPNHLLPSDNERDALASNGVGELKGDAKKMVKKISQLFKERRYLVGHIFYNNKEWHFFYFDQRDLEDEKINHWNGGSHIHFVNWLWPNYNPQILWDNFVNKLETPKGALHIRFSEKVSGSDI